MDGPKPQLIGIVGGSCAGKSWLADRLQRVLGKIAGRISLDDFYLDRSYLSEAVRQKINFDHPRAIDWKRVEKVLSLLREGKPAAVPRYNFVTHARFPEESILAPVPVVVMDGLWLFRKPQVRRQFTYRIFLKSPLSLCEERRLARDVAERGRDPESIRKQFWRDTVPMYERFVAPQEKWAEVVLEQTPDDQVVERIAKEVRELVAKGELHNE